MTVRMMPVVLMLSLLATCATGPAVNAATASGSDLVRYQCFAFVEPLGTDRAGPASTISQHRMTSSRRELDLRGLEFVENVEQADFPVRFFGHLDEQIRARQVDDPWYVSSFHDFHHDFYGTWPSDSTSIEVPKFFESALVIALSDTRTKQLVWEGTARKELTDRTPAPPRAGWTTSPNALSRISR